MIKMREDKTYKVAGLLLVMLISFLVIYLVLAVVKNWVTHNPSIMYRYASNYKMDSLVYLEKDAPETEGFLSHILTIEGVKDFYEKEDLHGVAEKLLEQFEKVRTIAESDTDYCKYLSKYNLTIDDFEAFLKRLMEFGMVTLKFAFFVSSFIVCFFWLGVFKLRIFFYLIAGLLNIFIQVSAFYPIILEPVVDMVNILPGIRLSYSDMNLLRDYCLSAYMESMMIWIIFDALLQLRDTSIKQKKAYGIEYYRESVTIQKLYLAENCSPDAIYRGRLNVDAECILKECKKHMKKASKELKCQKKTMETAIKRLNKTKEQFYRYLNSAEISNNLTDNIISLSMIDKEHDNQYYIDLLTSTEMLIAQAYQKGIIGDFNASCSGSVFFKKSKKM